MTLARLRTPLALLAALVPALLAAPAARASAIKPAPDPSAPPALSSAPAASADQEPDLDTELDRANDLYAEGLGLIRAGRAEEGRAKIKQAFGIIVDNLDDDASLPASLQLDFAAMLDKIRNWDILQPDESEAPGGLDVPDSALTGASAPGFEPIEIDTDNAIAQRFIQIYTKQRPRAVEDALARSGRYRAMIMSALKKRGMPPQLFYLVMTESEYEDDAVSPSGAAGLWQFMPGTARKYGLEVSYWVDERYDPVKATDAALHYLSDLYHWFGDWNLALAAYNRGEGGLGQDMKWSKSTTFGSLAGRDALPQQTHYYVPKFMACALIGSHPERFGLHPKYESPVEDDEVALPRQLDLSVAARCAGTTTAELHELNPELRAWATPKDRPGFILRLPQGTKTAFLAALAKVSDWTPGPTLVRYRVRRGDFLGRIARLNHTTVRSILLTNKIRNPRLLRPGTVLLIRPERRHETRARRPRPAGAHAADGGAFSLPGGRPGSP
ncbi:MAG: transglycosylase SLT domain-containing protein, partial [Elusimicrobia bacterium]|nr:transglycosylase SLT domain-containing protein [Elusimicrobiota bacterium]